MKIINLNSRSVTIELESNTPYYNEEEYEIFLNDNLIRKEKRNVFTIYDLEPDSDYKIEAQGIINFHTRPQTNLFFPLFCRRLPQEP